jgi:hypothetical protein
LNPVRITLSLAAASANNIALSQTPTSGSALTINGATASGGVATLDVARRVLLTYGSEGSARTLLVAGTNRSGNVISETLAVPSGGAGTVYTQQDFLTVTQLLPAGGGWTAAVTVGTNAVGSTPWVVREWGQLGKMGVLISIPASGPTVQLEATWDDPNGALEVYPYGASPEPTSAVPPLAVIAPASEAIFAPSTGLALASQSWAGITSTGGGASGAFDVPVFAVRMTQTAGTGLAVLYMIETTGDRKEAY